MESSILSIYSRASPTFEYMDVGFGRDLQRFPLVYNPLRLTPEVRFEYPLEFVVGPDFRFDYPIELSGSDFSVSRGERNEEERN